MRASDVMTRQVVTVAADASVMEAARRMLQQRVSGLPVVDSGGRLVGIVTEGDFLRRAEIGTEKRRPRWLEFLLGPGRLADEYVRASGRKVEEIMTRGPITISEDTPLDEVVRLMERRRVKRLPVTRGDALVGIVTRANLLRAVAALALEAAPPAGGDAAIRERLTSELEKHGWAPLGMLQIVVRNGVVDLWGSITEERVRDAIRVAAENIPGVKAVNDHLVWIDPASGMVLAPEEQKKTS